VPDDRYSVWKLAPSGTTFYSTIRGDFPRPRWVKLIGGTGQVGAAVVRALIAEPSCAEVIMVNRKAIPPTANPLD
jgi:hypothetical protein